MPAEEAISDELAENAIRQATEEADAQGIHGKDVTPFVLGRVLEITEGQSMKANIALLRNNAFVAAQIAAELSQPVTI